MGLGSQIRQAVAVQGTLMESLAAAFTASDSRLPAGKKKKLEKSRQGGASLAPSRLAVMSRAISPPLATEFFA